MKHWQSYFVIIFIASCALSALATYFLLPVLKKLKAGQAIREEGPEAHQKKAGTPTMGGIGFLLAFSVMMLFAIAIMNRNGFNSFHNADALMIILVTLAYAAIGFSDDYIKVMKKRNLGLTEIQKLALQIVIGVVVAIYSGQCSSLGTMVYIPFWKVYLNFGWVYYPFVVFVVVAMTNAVNLTDGLDGLAASVTGIVALVFCIAMLGIQGFATAGSVASIILCGACLGFLIFNHYPAKVFMGDTGSLALGGALTAIAISGGMHFILPIAGLIYVLEALSVIIQVFVFKTQNGRRFFRMAPLHHHFELGGMQETKVVAMFCTVSAVMGIIVILFA